jgi:transcription elongation GreA/GreB family factor
VNLKEGLHKYCIDIILEKKKVLLFEQSQAIESGNEESKSSAGDKHETSKAMMQLEQEKLGHQLLEVDKQLEILSKIITMPTTSKVQIGSLVETDQGKFYIAIGLGKIHFQDQDFFVISPQSPLGLKMIGKAKGEKIEINTSACFINSIT